MQPIIFVTQNKHKLDDAKKLLPDFNVENIDFEVPEIQSLDPKKIVEYKLQYAYEKLQNPCFVMDASLFFSCLNDFPGPFIKFWFEKTVGAEKTCQIANLFDDHNCKWTTVLGYYDGKESHYLEETVNGIIPNKPIGSNGYHWDTIFIPKGKTRTFAEMDFEEKQTFAVTKKLFDRFKDIL